MQRRWRSPASSLSCSFIRFDTTSGSGPTTRLSRWGRPIISRMYDTGNTAGAGCFRAKHVRSHRYRSEPASADADEAPRASRRRFLSFRKERPSSSRQVSELSLPGMMSDNQQAGRAGRCPAGWNRCTELVRRCLSGRTVERARSMPQEQALVCPASTSTSFIGNRRMVIGSRCQSTCGQHRPSRLSGLCSRELIFQFLDAGHAIYVDAVAAHGADDDAVGRQAAKTPERRPP